MGDDGERHDEDSGGAKAEDDGRIDVGLLVQNELESIKGMGANVPVGLGPRPRSLSRARIQAKSDACSPRVRSSKLRPRRHQRTEPRPHPSSSAGREGSEVVETLGDEGNRDVPRTAHLLPDVEEVASKEERDAQRGPRRRILAPLQIVAALLLLETALMPSVRARHVVPPWSAWSDPTSPNFVALSFLALLALLFLFPLSRIVRTGLQALAAGLLIIFSLVLLRSALSLHLFDAQPALHLLFVESLSAGLVLVFVACLLPTTLFWLHGAPESRSARRGILASVSLVLVSYLGLAPLVDLEATPLVLLFSVGAEGAFIGDRVASWLCALPLFGALLSLLLYKSESLSAWTGLMGVIFWLVALAPLSALALYVAPLERWQEVLVPTQITTLLGSGVLLLAVCLGHVLALREIGEA